MSLSQIFNKFKNLADKGIYFIQSADKINYLSYQEIYNKSLCLLHEMQQKGLKPGDELIFQLTNPEEFIIFFWASIIGGIIPVPVSIGVLEEHKLKMIKIWNILSNPYLAISENNLEKMSSIFLDKEINSKNRILVSDSLITSKKNKAAHIERDPEDIAFIQFSSGSTGTPKGIMLTHKNLMTNLDGITKAAQMDENDSFFSWMPLTHDMGLIGFHLVPSFLNINQAIMPTELFIRRPVLWMELANKLKASILSSPNFGLNFFLKYFKNTENYDWDLSKVRLLFNGAEPISAELCDDFIKVLKPFGLQKTSIFTVYGLAEASLAVAFPPVNKKFKTLYIDRNFLLTGQAVKIVKKTDKNALSFVIEGRAIPHTAFRIVNEKGQPLPELTIGIIEIKGENVTKGFYKNPEATQKCINNDGWLNTGDLGFVKRDELVVTGRLKDIIFSNGQNFYSHDLERIIENQANIEPGRIVVAGSWNELRNEDDILVFTIHKKSDLHSFLPFSQNIKKIIINSTGLKVTHVIPVDRIPKTTSGKVQRFKLVQNFLNDDYKEKLTSLKELEISSINPETSSISAILDIEEITLIINKEIYKLLGFYIDDMEKSLNTLGIDSIRVLEFVKQLESRFSIDLPVSTIFDYPTLKKLSKFILRKLGDKANINNRDEKIHEYSDAMDEQDVAIIGIGCRFPGGADSPELLWGNLINRIDGITHIPTQRWNRESYYDPMPATPGKYYTMQGGFLNKIDFFDAELFGITPIEATEIDPQQRILLEVSWEALENAAVDYKKLENSQTGVFIGISNNEYSELTLKNNHELNSYTLTGSMLSTAAGRISYVYGFQGPAITVDTACSSSLVSINQAVQSLVTNQCDLALAGGVNIILSPKSFIGLSQLNALSPEGRCKSFDDNADGFGRAEGCGIIVLKKLKKAIQDNDRIIAIIKGSAMNHDGKSSGLTVPNGLQQQAVIKSALKNAHLNTEDIDYIEAHGSGTRLGDPQEVNALAEVFSKRNNSTKLKIGSVKTNLGHCESASGIAGVIKTALALWNKTIPGQIHFTKPNQLIPWDKIPIEVVDKTIPWIKVEGLRTAGVSAFGLSGTNVHIILQEYITKADSDNHNNSTQIYPLIFSAHSNQALIALKEKYISFLNKTEKCVSDISYTSIISKGSMDFRSGVIGKNKTDWIKALTVLDESYSEKSIKKSKKVVFLYAGQGSQYKNLGKDLFEKSEVFKKNLLLCDSLFKKEINKSIVDLLYNEKVLDQELTETQNAQPVIFSIQYALTKLWQSYGVSPSAVTGHSIGQYCAAVIAGVMKIEDAVKLVSKRSILMSKAPKNGGMAVIFANETEIIKLMEKTNELEIAAVNSPANVTISGNIKILDSFLKQLERKKIGFKKLIVSHGFHSFYMDSIIDEFAEITKTISYKEAIIPIVSDNNGGWANNIDWSNYWVKHLRESIRFNDAINTLLSEGFNHFIEISGSSGLLSLIKEIDQSQGSLILATLSKKDNSWEYFLKNLLELYKFGYPINWTAHEGYLNANKIELPTYAFQRERFWKDSSAIDLDHYFHSVNWYKNEIIQQSFTTSYSSIIIGDSKELDKKVIESLKENNPDSFILDIKDILENNFDTQNIEKLFLDSHEKDTIKIIHLVRNDSIEINSNHFIELHDIKCKIISSVIKILKILNKKDWDTRIEFWFLAQNGISVNNDLDSLNIDSSVLWGLVRTLELESPQYHYYILDIDNLFTDELSPQIIFDEIKNSSNTQVAYRKNVRYIPMLDTIKNDQATLHKESKSISIKKHGVYLITGGLGNIGLIYARWLIEKGASRIFLTSRKPPDPKTIDIINHLRQSQCEIITINCDITVYEDIKRLFAEISKYTSKLNGIFHAAGIIKYSLFTDTNEDEFYSVLAPKVIGSWNLHKITEQMDIDFMIFLSSSSTIMGLSGYSSYVIANTFLNSLASYRNTKKLHTININWGPWEQYNSKGMASDSKGMNLKSIGVNNINNELALKITDRIFELQINETYILDINWKQYLQFVPESQLTGIYKLFDSQSIQKAPSKTDLISTLIKAKQAKRFDILQKFIKELLAKIMGYQDTNKISTDNPLMDQGVDSLIFLQLKEKLTKALNCRIEVSIFFNYPTIDSITEYILKDILVLQEDEKTSEDIQQFSLNIFSEEIIELEKLIETVNTR